MADVGEDDVDLDEEVKNFIDSEIGDNLKLLPKVNELLSQLAERKRDLEDQLSVASSEVPQRIHGALHDAESALEQMQALSASEKQTRNDITEHLTQAQPIIDGLAELTNQVKELEKCMSYLNWVEQVEQLSSDIQGSLLVNSTPFQLFHSSEIQQSLVASAMPSAVVHFASMAELSDLIQGSSCHHLIDFVNSTVLFWYKILNEKLSSEFDEVVRALGWPFITAVKPSTPSANQGELKQKMETLFSQLLKLQLPDNLSSDDKSALEYSALPGCRPILLPLQLLIKPLKKRFKYHFYGKKQTNNISKPEWYFTQVLNWIRDHCDFLDQVVQPILNKAGLTNLDARVEFTRGLMLIVTAKLSHDIPELLYDEHLLSHTIDEALLFDREVRTNFGYPAGQPGCLFVLTNNDCFEKWVNVEKKFATEKIESLMSSQNAWTSQYKDISDVDELKVPECGENFMTLLIVITDRYKNLPYPTHRLQFLDLQLYLLDDFRIRLLQVKKEEAKTPLGPKYSAILNVLNYVIEVLQEWSDQVFFLQLQYFKAEHHSMESFNTAMEQSYTSSTDQSSITAILEDSKLDNMEGTVFDETVKLYKRLRDEMVVQIALSAVEDIKVYSRQYRQEKWFSLPSHKDFIVLGLSASACEMFQVLKDRLHLVKQQVCQSLFNTVWQKVAESLNMFIYEEVILGNRFNEGGAAQLQYDMTRNLFPMFGEFTQRPDNHFKDVKEACILLNLNLGSAILLRDILFHALHEDTSDDSPTIPKPRAALNDVGVYRLTPGAAERIINLRTDWPKT
ncbi:RAD50-interacting protein 1-like isoform X1 [Ptychodera flava]|uniref:RAD50-interacting protein 1-like isoform X1 n=1 Tax=Ptychodera flava TaxID=63121 RepID=UPI00396A2EB9